MTDDSADKMVTFEETGAARARRVVAKLGVVNVGAIYVDTGSHGALWRTLLPGLSPDWRPARGVAEAKERLTAEVAQWVDAAGLAPATARETGIRAVRLFGGELRRASV